MRFVCIGTCQIRPETRSKILTRREKTSFDILLIQVYILTCTEIVQFVSFKVAG